MKQRRKATLVVCLGNAIEASSPAIRASQGFACSGRALGTCSGKLPPILVLENRCWGSALSLSCTLQVLLTDDDDLMNS